MEHSTSEQIVLMCQECGEKLIILGPEEDWRSRHAVFVCKCRHKLTFGDLPDEEVLTTS